MHWLRQAGRRWDSGRVLRARRRRSQTAFAIILFVAGAAFGWMVHAKIIEWTPRAESTALRARDPIVITAAGPADSIATTGSTAVPSRPLDTPASLVDTIDALRQRDLRFPIEGADRKAIKGQFAEKRVGGGGHTHEAVDILAPRGAAIRAVDSGTIAKLFLSKAGGTTIYQFDATGRFCYYYAHLEGYATNLREGLEVKTGDIIGYVGTSGNAPKNTPHLHFAIFELTPERRWWKGRAIDPDLVFEN